jgi:hypothetical protein
MLRPAINALLLALALTACTLTTTRPLPTPTAEPILTATATLSLLLTPTPTTSPTLSPTPLVTAPPACFVRTDWPLYTVVEGDTLASIATRVSSSTAELAQANCLSNPNLIRPGQQLRVPRLPNPDTQIGSITISPIVSAEGGAFTVRANTPLTLSWPQAPRDATRVEFYAAPFLTNPPATLLGTDTFPGDGAAISLTLPSGFQQAVYAIGYLPAGNRQLTALRVPVFAVDANPNVAPVFQPNLGMEGDVTVLPAGTITTTWPSPVVAQSSYVEFTLIRFGTQRELLGRDTNMADGAQITWLGGDVGPTGIHQFEAVAFFGSGIVGLVTVPVRFQAAAQQQGDILITPIIRTEGDVKVVELGRTITLNWRDAPTTQSSQFEFILIEDGVVGPVSIGIDSNSADGVSVPWTVTTVLNNARIIARARTPLQTGQIIESSPARVRSEQLTP